MTGRLDERTRRIAVNETRFRAINDRLERDLRGVGAAEGSIEFVCECGYADCRATITMDRAAYEAVRTVSTHFALVSGHEITDVETVVETHAIVEEADPRQP